MTRTDQAVRLTRLELMLFLREPVGTFFTLAFPVILLLTIGSAFGDEGYNDGRYEYIDVYVPSLYAMIVANLGMMSVPIILGEYRDTGYLKTLLATPLPRSLLVAAQSVALGAIAVVGALIVAAVALAVFGLRFGGSVPFLLLFLALGAAAFFGTGHLLATVFKSVRSSQAVGSATFFVMLFLSGAAIPRSQFPEWLADLGATLPLAQLNDPLVNLWTGESLADQWGHALYLVVMATVVISATAWLGRRREF